MFPWLTLNNQMQLTLKSLTLLFEILIHVAEAVARRCSVKTVLLEISQKSQEYTYARVSFLLKLQAWYNFIKKEALAQVFFCEFCEISKNILFTEHFWAIASDVDKITFALFNIRWRTWFNIIVESESLYYHKNIFIRCLIAIFN